MRFVVEVLEVRTHVVEIEVDGPAFPESKLQALAVEKVTNDRPPADIIDFQPGEVRPC